MSFTSEASRLSRLYWWTSEYGLVGTPQVYRLYGAGLLSSLWESHSCHDASVRKLPLSAACVEQAYDITRTQPQLFVARDFEQLFDVLSEVDASLVYRAGGQRALDAALASAEVATLAFGDERFVTGQLKRVHGNARAGLLSFQGPVGLGAGGRLQAKAPAIQLPFGRLLGPEPRWVCGQPLQLAWPGGVTLRGQLTELTRDARGLPLLARFMDYRLSCEGSGLDEQGAEYLLLLAPELVTAYAGAGDSSFFPPSEVSRVRVPKPRTLQERERALLALYEQAIAAFRERLGSHAVPAFTNIHYELTRSFPDEWLLRWNLLECLCKLGSGGSADGPLARTLEQELLALELKFAHKEPIASGLRYLSGLAA